MSGPIDPVTEMIMKLLAEGAGKGLPMQPSPGLRGHMNARTRGFPAPRESNVVPGPGYNPPISQDPWFNDPASQFADEARLPPTRFQQEAGEFTDETMSPEAVVGASIPKGNGEFYIWAVQNGKKIRVDGPFGDQLSAQRELNMMAKQDPQLLRRMGAFIAGPEDSA